MVTATRKKQSGTGPRINARMITFRGKRLRVKNVVGLHRHSDRGSIVKGAEKGPLPFHFLWVPLTAKGRQHAREKGKRIPQGLNLHMYYSPASRTMETAHWMGEGYKSSRKGSKKRKEPFRRVQYSTWEEMPWRDPSRVDYARLHQFIRNWLDGKIPSDIAMPPHEYADKIIRNKLRITERLDRISGKEHTGNYFLFISHDSVVAAVLERLIGKKTSQLKVSLPQPNEGITLYHAGTAQNPRIILEFQGRKFDVTKRYRAIISQKSK